MLTLPNKAVPSEFRLPPRVCLSGFIRAEEQWCTHMSTEKKDNKKEAKAVKKIERKKKKKNALVLCHDGKEYWTTQTEFWQWVRERVVMKISDRPLKGRFIHQNEEYNVVIRSAVLNLKCPNHLREVLDSSRRTYR